MSNKRKNSIDIPIVVALVLLADLFALVPELASTPIRMILGLIMVLFLPGSALVAALFPAKDDLDGIERLALGLGLSFAIVPLIGLGAKLHTLGHKAHSNFTLFIGLYSFHVYSCYLQKISSSF